MTAGSHLHLREPSVAAGATILAEHDEWTVLADPEGGEFCAFVPD